MNKRILAVFTILIIALAIAGFGYSVWTSTLYIEGTVNLAELSIYIQDYNNTNGQLSADKHTLTITDTITPGQTLWTGIIIKNNSTTPVTITRQITTDNPLIWETNFTHNEYFYGPYLESDDISGVWNESPTLPPVGEQLTPPETPAKNKLVTWQNITLDSNCPPDAFTTIEITVAYIATFSSWTDTVYVKYTLTFQAPPP